MTTLLNTIAITAAAVALAYTLLYLVPKAAQSVLQARMLDLAIDLEAHIDSGALPATHPYIRRLRDVIYALAERPARVSLSFVLSVAAANLGREGTRRTAFLRVSSPAQHAVLDQVENRLARAVISAGLMNNPAWLAFWVAGRLAPSLRRQRDEPAGVMNALAH